MNPDQSASRSVLLVEDNKALGRLYQEVLTKAGFEVVREEDGQQALEQFLSRPFSVLVTDLLLPGLDGFRLVKQIRGYSTGQQLPVVIITGIFKSEHNEAELRRTLGVSSFLHKPIDLEALVRAVRRAVNATPVQP